MDPLKELQERCNLEFCEIKKILICRTCPIVLTSKLQAHLEVHSIHISHTENEMLQKCFFPESKYLKPTKELLEPVPGFRITEGYMCKNCTYYTPFKNAFNRHTRVFHEGRDEFEQCHMQRLFSKGGHNYVGVKADPKTVVPRKPLKTFKNTPFTKTRIQKSTIDPKVNRESQENGNIGIFAVEDLNSSFPCIVGYMA